MTVSDFTPAGAQTGLLGFYLEYGCGSTCDGLSKISDTLMYAETVFDWDGSTLSTSGSLTRQYTFGSNPGTTRSDTSTSMVQSKTVMTAGELSAAGLPTSTENFYYKCWNKINTTTYVSVTRAVSDFSTGATVLDVAVERNKPTPTPTPTPTPSTSTPTTTSSAEVIAILAAAGSGLASFLL